MAEESDDTAVQAKQFDTGVPPPFSPSGASPDSQRFLDELEIAKVVAAPFR